MRRFGGGAGTRDEGLLRPALEQPVGEWHDARAELPDLAAAYAFGLAKNRGFVDGDKRVAFMGMMIFLRRNGAFFAPEQALATKIIQGIAAGEVSEASLARWIRDNWPKP